MRNWFSLIVIIFIYFNSYSQEFNCKVTVLNPQVQTSEKEIFKNLELDIQDFINTRRWTQHLFASKEKIDCSMIITIDKWENETFSGNLQIKATRPVFKSNYNTPILIYKDNDITFKYTEFTTLEWDENSIPDNLIALISYYIYLILGLDYDSFELYGGKPFFEKASLLVQQMQSSQDNGWQSFQNKGNRYWLIDNIQNPSYNSFHECMYLYHRLGLDGMSNDLEGSKTQIKNSLLLLEKIYSIKKSSHLLQVFFETKSEEIVKMLNGFSLKDKALLKPFLMEINPENTYKYKNIKAT